MLYVRMLDGVGWEAENKRRPSASRSAPAGRRRAAVERWDSIDRKETKLKPQKGHIDENYDGRNIVGNPPSGKRGW